MNNKKRILDATTPDIQGVRSIIDQQSYLSLIHIIINMDIDKLKKKKEKKKDNTIRDSLDSPILKIFI